MIYSHLRADCLYTPGSDLGPTLGNEYEKPLPLPFQCSYNLFAYGFYYSFVLISVCVFVCLCCLLA